MRATLDFLLNDWLKVGELCVRPRFADQRTGTFGAVLDSQQMRKIHKLCISQS